MNRTHFVTFDCINLTQPVNMKHENNFTPRFIGFAGLLFMMSVSCRQAPDPVDEMQVYTSEQAATLLANAITVEAIGEPEISTVTTLEANKDSLTQTTVTQYFKVFVATDDKNNLIPRGEGNSTTALTVPKGPVVIGRSCSFSCKRITPYNGGELCPGLSGCIPPAGASLCVPANCGSECDLAQECKESLIFAFGFYGRIIF